MSRKQFTQTYLKGVSTQYVLHKSKKITACKMFSVPKKQAKENEFICPFRQRTLILWKT